MPTEFSVSSDDLYFDPDNPRLVGAFDTQSKMFRFLITDVGVDDLLESISTSGYFNADPMIVKKRRGGGYFVIEGNRRLAAIKLLLGHNPDDKLSLPSIPKVSKSVHKTLAMIPVQSDWDDSLLEAYLGYKHVTAAREWSPEAKAKFVYDHAQGDYSTANLDKFAHTVGTRPPTLKRWLSAYLVLKQAEKKGLFDPENVPSKGYFGTFYTLLGGSQAQAYLKLKETRLTDSPVPTSNLKQLSQFIKWTIGTKENPSVVNSRQQKPFEKVLASPKAIKHFAAKSDLNASLYYTEYNEEEIAAKLEEASFSIDECLPKLYDVRKKKVVIQAFSELEGAYNKAKLNMKADSAANKK